MNTEQIALADRVRRHAALADAARLAVVDELVLGDRSPSELQAILGLPSNLLAHHLKVLEDAGLVTRHRSEGDRRRTYLTLSDTTELSPRVLDVTRVGRVVFVCSANSARSQLAAALWVRASDVPVSSAGTRPAEQISAGAQAAAERRSLTLLSSVPQQLAGVEESDFVIAVCDNAHEELGGSVALHWSIPDPVARGGDAAFDRACDELDRRITALAPHLIAS